MEVLMEYFEVHGGIPLKGDVNVSGAKNAAFPILSAALLIKGKMRFYNLPKILDILSFLEVLKDLGVDVQEEKDYFIIDTSKDISLKISSKEYYNLRGTQTLLGALVGRNGEANLPSLGGCNIGTRPIDLHIKGIKSLGVDIGWEGGYLRAKVKDTLKGNLVYLDFPSVGATENLIIAATLASGETVIENAAKEPEIKDLARFLNLAGANIEMNGSGVIKINGVKNLHPVDYKIIPDRIESSTYLIAGIMTKGDIVLRNCNPWDFESVIMKLREAGAEITANGNEVRGEYKEKLHSVNIKTLPFPGFPTDVQPQMMALLSTAQGTGVIIETIFENRFRAAEELIKMGANIRIEGNTSVITGVKKLEGSNVTAPDLRGGAALLIASLSSEGKTKIFEPYHIDRGYENIIKKIIGLGGVIERRNIA
jgi:UDP-N-acetylglucosamine 1-carboxyvinyltransferase